MYELLQGDCTEEHIWIPDGSVDLVLSDPPYGTIKGLGLKSWKASDTEWDVAIPPAQIFEIANRILRKNGKLVLFSQEPYTSKLITEAIPNLPFNYRMAWVKENFANHLSCKKAPVSYYEDVLVFSKKHELDNIHPLRSYFAEVFNFIGKIKKEILQEVGNRADHVLRVDSPQFSLCTRETYEALSDIYALRAMLTYESYDYLKQIDNQHKARYASVFNLWQGKAFKGNLLYYAKDMDGYHPTQKPVALLEDLIQTYTREGDTVADLTMGSNSTGVACVNTDRYYYGIEKSPKYYKIAVSRNEEAQMLK